MSSVFDLFNELQRDGFSGEVEVTSSQGHAIILLKEGRFVWAHRTLDRALERFQKVSWLQVPPQMPIGPGRTWAEFVLAIIEANPEQYNRVVKLLKMDRMEVFFRLFFWSNLEMIQRPVDADALLSSGELSFYSLREFDPLVAEARKRVAEWPDMKLKMGSSRRIFMSQVEPSSLKVEYDATEDTSKISEGDNADGLPNIPFSSDEIEILKHCDGRNTVQDLVRVLPDGEFLIVRRLLELWRKGAVRPKDDEESVVSIHARTNEISAQDILRSAAVGIFVSFVFLALARFIPNDVLIEATPQQIQQALLIYRRTEGHYPASLIELPPKLFFSRQNLRLYDYSLTDPLHFELKPKGK